MFRHLVKQFAEAFDKEHKNVVRDNATGEELLKLATLEVAGANAFNRADGQGKGFWAAYPDVNQVVTILASVYDGEVPMLGQKNKAFLDA